MSICGPGNLLTEKESHGVGKKRGGGGVKAPEGLVGLLTGGQSEWRLQPVSPRRRQCRRSSQTRRNNEKNGSGKGNAWGQKGTTVEILCQGVRAEGFS